MDFTPLFRPETLAVIGMSMHNDQHPAKKKNRDVLKKLNNYFSSVYPFLPANCSPLRTAYPIAEGVNPKYRAIAVVEYPNFLTPK